MRQKGARSRGRSLAWVLVKWGAILGLLATALGVTSVALLCWIWGSDPVLPRINKLKDYEPKQVTKVLSKDGRLMGEIFEERRTVVALEKIAPIMVQAIIDAEDAQYREHQGLDFKGMLRALWVNVTSGETRQGGSTITMQVVKSFLPERERTLKYKVQQILMARRLEGSLSKDEILTLYLNQIYFGHGRYGIEEAAQFFFGKSALDLGVGEASLLAGLPQSPERLSPHKNPEAAKARQIYVLRQMVARGHLSEAGAKLWVDDPIRVVPARHEATSSAPELLEVVREELVSRYGAAKLPYLGLVVQTTLDPEIQEAAREAVKAGLEEIDERHGYRGPVARLSEAEARSKLSRLAKEMPKGGPRLDRTYHGVVVELPKDGTMRVDLGGWTGDVALAGRDAARYTRADKKSSFSKGDLVVVRRIRDHELVLELGPQAAVVVIDPKTRDVLAMVGGYDQQAGRFNRALHAKRQPGSAFKPLVYATALDSGKLTPASIVNDAPEVYDLWKPKNHTAGKFLGPVRLRTALALSINTVAIRVLHDVGARSVIELAHAMGIRSKLPEELSLALGAGEVTPIDLANAFATFAAEGMYAPPRFILSVGDERLLPPEPRQVLRPEVAYLTTSLMQSVVEEGTASAAKKLRRKLAGKTGTANRERDSTDAWFVGFAPDLVCGVWVGFDDMRGLGHGESGARSALPIWIRVMQEALKGRGAKSFRRPAGLVAANIDRRTGKLAAEGAAEADVLEEVFLPGTEPTEVAPAPGEVPPEEWILEEMEDRPGDPTSGPEPPR